MNTLFLMITILLGGGLIVAAVFILRAIYKKRLNERFRTDRETLASGGVPSSSAGRHEISGLSAVALVLAIVAYTGALVALGYSLSGRLENRIGSSENNTKKQIQQILTEIEELKEEEKRSRSILSYFGVYTPKDSWNEEDMTVRYQVIVVPKEITADTAVSLTVDGTAYETQRNGTEFSAYVVKPMFEETTDGHSLCVGVTSGGVTKTEILTEDDTGTYQTLDNLFYTHWLSFFPSMWNMTTQIGHQTVPELKKGTYEIDYWFDVAIAPGQNGIKKCTVGVYAGDRVLLEQDLTDRIVMQGGDQNAVIRDVKVEGKWNDVEADYVDMVFSITDTKGYTVSNHERAFSDKYSENYPVEHLINYPYWTLTAPDGTVYAVN